jgi:hypothetical protein
MTLMIWDGSIPEILLSRMAKTMTIIEVKLSTLHSNQPDFNWFQSIT